MTWEVIPISYIQGASMKQIIISIITKILSIYNIKVSLGDGDIEEKLDDMGYKVKPICRIKKDTSIMEFAIPVRTIEGWCVYSFSKNITDGQINGNIKDINFICGNCFRALKQLLTFYSLGVSSKIEINGYMEETIEASIIAISIKDKQVNSYLNLRVELISDLLHSLNKWSNRTYEGRKIPFSLLVDVEKIEKNNFGKLCAFLKDDASALLTDGISSYLEISDTIAYKVAKFYDAEQISEKSNIPLVPYRFSSFGNICTGKNLGIVLTVQGDILFIQERKLIFAKRNGEWHAYDNNAFIDALFRDVPEMHVDANKKNNRIKMIYLTCLDVAFARTGGCLAICQKEKITKLKKSINENDVHKQFNKKERLDHNYKRYFLEDVVINQNFFNTITRKARQELLGVDGATVITTDGKFITTGAIMDNSFTNSVNDLHGGARTKIAMKLSEYGIAIKISADGYIECYKNLKHIY